MTNCVYSSISYCFESKSWKDAIGNNVVQLEHVYRQQTDQRFITLLQEVRAASLSQSSVDLLISRSRPKLLQRLSQCVGVDLMEFAADDQLIRKALVEHGVSSSSLPDDLAAITSDIEPTKLLARNTGVDRINDEGLKRLKGDTVRCFF